MIGPTIDALVAAAVTVVQACALVGRPRARHYRHQQQNRARPESGTVPVARARPVNALDDEERERVLAVLRSPEHCDRSAAQVWARELDEGRYYCSVSTMYRILRAHGEVSERRAQATRPAKVKPELIAFNPNEVWSWDITKLRGPSRGVYYDLYVLLDIYSRYVTGYLVAPRESGELAKDLIADAVRRHGIARDQLALHADRGTSMTSKPVSQLLSDLDIVQSHSRPHVSNDNPYSEAQFKTLKYCPAFPGHFGSLEDAKTFCDAFFSYYNEEHCHSGLGLHTPASVHYGTASAIRARRAQTLTAAYRANPTRFSKPPIPPRLPAVAWINPPTPQLIQSA